MFARIEGGFAAPVFIGQSDNAGRDFATFSFVRIATGIHRCDTIFWHFGPPGEKDRQHIQDDLIRAFHPPMNDLEAR